MLSELAFRAQLVIREQRELFDYWRACAKGTSMPSRAHISPASIPALLPGISILDAGRQPDEINTGSRVHGFATFSAAKSQVNRCSIWNSAKSAIIGSRSTAR